MKIKILNGSNTQKSIGLFLACMGMAYGMDGPPAPQPKPEKAIRELQQDQSNPSLLSQIPDELIPDIEKYEGFTFTCPTGEEITKSKLENKGKMDFKLKDEENNLNYDVNTGLSMSGPYTFDYVGVGVKKNSPSVECHYKSSSDKGKPNARLYIQALKAKGAVSCQGDPKFKIREYKYGGLVEYQTDTHDSKDIVIRCITE